MSLQSIDVSADILLEPEILLALTGFNFACILVTKNDLWLVDLASPGARMCLWNFCLSVDNIIHREFQH